MKKSAKKNKGFTLIELLIVVAIIAILAAIAIPQFSQYRVRAYNGTAETDIRNIKVQAETYKIEWRVYASSMAAGVPGLGTIRQGPATVDIIVDKGGIAAGFPASNGAQFTFGLSNGVYASVCTTPLTGNEMTAFTKHTSGDKYFAVDSEVASINYKSPADAADTMLKDSDLIASGTGNEIAAAYPTAL